MLTKLQAYSSWESAPLLPLSDSGREETDLLQIRNVDGLDPVKATINTSAFGSVDGGAYIGANVPTRNIVLTIHPNPDWGQWTFEGLRRAVYDYFMPKLMTRLVFTSDDIPPVEIYGYVEGCTGNPFTKDVEILVSIICPDPYFTAVNPTIVTGISSDGSNPFEIDYNGNVETGFNVEVIHTNDPSPTTIGLQLGDPALSFFNVAAGVNEDLYLIMNSIPGQKYVQNVDTNTGVIKNLLSKLQTGSQWPTLKPGTNEFSVITDSPNNQDWRLTYFERRGGL